MEVCSSKFEENVDSPFMDNSLPQLADSLEVLFTRDAESEQEMDCCPGL